MCAGRHQRCLVIFVSLVWWYSTRERWFQCLQVSYFGGITNVHVSYVWKKNTVLWPLYLHVHKRLPLGRFKWYFKRRNKNLMTWGVFLWENHKIRFLTQLLQQAGFELFEVVTKSQILLDKMIVTFKSNKNWVKVIAYFCFKISHASPFWILWRHVVAAIVSKQSIFCVKQLGNQMTSCNPRWLRAGNWKANIGDSQTLFCLTLIAGLSKFEIRQYFLQLNVRLL